MPRRNQDHCGEIQPRSARRRWAFPNQTAKSNSTIWLASSGTLACTILWLNCQVQGELPDGNLPFGGGYNAFCPMIVTVWMISIFRNLPIGGYSLSAPRANRPSDYCILKSIVSWSLLQKCGGDLLIKFYLDLRFAVYKIQLQHTEKS